MSENVFHPTPNGFLNFFVNWFNENVADFDVEHIEPKDVYIVWFNYTLGKAKCLISTTRMDHKYYEITYNDVKSCIYVDMYVKVRNQICKVDEYA